MTWCPVWTSPSPSAWTGASRRTGCGSCWTRSGPAGLRFFGVDLGGVRLCADDLDWSHGSGAPVTGSAQDLLLLAYGRRLPEGRLQGERSGRFTLAEGR